MLFFLLALGLADLALSRQITVGPIILFFLAVKMQADIAAAKFMREGLKYPSTAGIDETPEEGFHFEPPRWGKEDIPEWNDYTAPKQRSPQPEQSQSSESRSRPNQEQKFTGAKPLGTRASESLKKSEKRAEPKSQKRARSEFKLPKFLGTHHEVLGINENAATMTIVAAFRHWIKKHHPDKSGPNTQSAHDHAIKLNAAKEALLERRKRLKKSA